MESLPRFGVIAMNKSPVHVAVGVVSDAAGNILLARRPDHLHQGGLWEFPGGKVESGEQITAALARELHEEIGIVVTGARPLIRIHHDYGDRHVLLNVWRVTTWDGDVHGREGQPVAWVAPEALSERPMPVANLPIVAAARLPDFYAVTPEPVSAEETLARLGAWFRNGVTLAQLRAKRMTPDTYAALAQRAVALAREHGATLLLNAPPELAVSLRAGGVHLTSARLMALRERPLPAEMWVAASCHCREELEHAERIGADFAVLGPVLLTRSHPGAPALGWERFHELTERAKLPVYALGGLGMGDLPRAWSGGAQGVAALSAAACIGGNTQAGGGLAEDSSRGRT